MHLCAVFLNPWFPRLEPFGYSGWIIRKPVLASEQYLMQQSHINWGAGVVYASPVQTKYLICIFWKQFTEKPQMQNLLWVARLGQLPPPPPGPHLHSLVVCGHCCGFPGPAPRTYYGSFCLFQRCGMCLFSQPFSYCIVIILCFCKLHLHVISGITQFL